LGRLRRVVDVVVEEEDVVVEDGVDVGVVDVGENPGPTSVLPWVWMACFACPVTACSRTRHWASINLNTARAR